MNPISSTLFSGRKTTGVIPRLALGTALGVSGLMTASGGCHTNPVPVSGSIISVQSTDGLTAVTMSLNPDTGRMAVYTAKGKIVAEVDAEGKVYRAIASNTVLGTSINAVATYSLDDQGNLSGIIGGTIGLHKGSITDDGWIVKGGGGPVAQVKIPEGRESKTLTKQEKAAAAFGVLVAIPEADAPPSRSRSTTSSSRSRRGR